MGSCKRELSTNRSRHLRRVSCVFFCLLNSLPSLYVVLWGILIRDSGFEGILQGRFDEKCG